MTFALAGSVLAQDEFTHPLQGSSEFSLSIGYANISVGGSSSELNDQGALKLDPVFSFSPVQALPQVRLGLSGSFAMVLDNSSRTFIFNDGNTIITGHSEIPFVMFEPEVRLSWRQLLGDKQNIFIEPGVGFGGAIGWLQIDSDDSSGGDDNSTSESDATWEARTFLYVGMEVTGGSAGFEFSYMQGGNMDLADNANGDVSEFYVGFFGALQF